MTRDEAAEILREHIRVDREIILEGREARSKFDKAIEKRDEAFEFLLGMLDCPMNFLEPHERVIAYREQQRIYDISDMEQEVFDNAEWYEEKFGIEIESVTREEIKRMAELLREKLDADADATWNVCREEAAKEIMDERKGKDHHEKS